MSHLPHSMSPPPMMIKTPSMIIATQSSVPSSPMPMPPLAATAATATATCTPGLPTPIPITVAMPPAPVAMPPAPQQMASIQLPPVVAPVALPLNPPLSEVTKLADQLLARNDVVLAALRANYRLSTPEAVSTNTVLLPELSYNLQQIVTMYKQYAYNVVNMRTDSS